MIPQLGWIRGVVGGRFFLRAGFYGVAAILLALLAEPVATMLPVELSGWVEEPSIRDLLEVIASSMLVVATFSLATMVAAYAAAAQSATPWATKVMIDDPIAQSVIATYVGAFVFAAVGLVGLSLGLYDADGRVLLLVATAAVLFVVIVTLFGWIDYLTNLVRLGAVLNKVEAAAERALAGDEGAPFLGARPAPDDPPAGHAIRLGPVGYVTGIDMACLETVAARRGGAIRLVARPGRLAGHGAPVAFASFAPDAREARRIAEAFTVGAERTIEQDARYGLIVLAEVATRALSPGVNDPGTAIGVIGRLQRLLTLWAESVAAAPQVRFPHVEAPPIAADELCEDAFGPLARDGAAMVEVGVRLQKTLLALAGLGEPSLAAAALRQSERALAQARARLALESDRDEVARLAAAVADAAAPARAAAVRDATP